MPNQKEYRTALIVTGDSRGGVRAAKLTEDSLRKLSRQQNQSESVAAKYARTFGRATKQMISYTAAAVGIASLTLFPAAAIADAARFESQLVSVGKTTDITGADLQQLGKEVDSMTRRLPVSSSRLLDLATSAGQLGVKGSENILSFTETLAKLEQTTDLVGEEGAKSIARILNVTGDGIETVDRFGSVLVALGNNSAASEREIVRITTEIARSASAFDIGATQAAAMGASMASLGIRAEVGGSAVGRTLQTITNALQRGDAEVEKFARQFDLTGQQLAEAFERDRVEGLVLFLEGVASQGQGAGAALDAVGLGGQEIAKTIVPLANNLEVLIKSLALANDEAENATALNSEFEKSLNTLTAQYTLFKNNVTATTRSITMGFLPAMTNTLSVVNRFIENDLEVLSHWFLGLAGTLAVGGALQLGLKATAIGFSGIAAAAGTMVAATVPLWGVVAAAAAASVAALKFGQHLRDEYELVTDVGNEFVRYTLYGWETLKLYAASAAVAISSYFASLWNDLLKMAADFLNDIGRLAEKGRGIVPGMGAIADATSSLADKFRESKIDLEQYEKQQELLTAGYKANLREINANISAMQGLVPITVTATKWTEKHTAAVEERSAAGKEALKLTETEAERLKSLQDELFPLEKLLKEHIESQNLLNLARQAGDITAAEYSASMSRLATRYDEARNRALGLKDETNALAAEMERAVERIDDAFFDLFRSAFDDWKSFKNQLINSAKDLAAQMAYQFTKQQFGFSSSQLAFAGSSAGSLLSGGAGGSGGVGGSLLGSALGGLGLKLGGLGAGGLIGNLGSALGISQGSSGLLSGTVMQGVNPATGYLYGTQGVGEGVLKAGGQGFNAGGFNFNPMDFLKTAGAGIAGGFLGSGVGTAITGKSGSGAGAAIGGVVGSAIPVIGTFLGSAIGGLLDSVFGSGGYDRWFEIQPGERTIGRQGFDGANIGNVSRSAFGAVTFNTEGKLFEGATQDQAQSVINTLEAFADVEDQIASYLSSDQLNAVGAAVARQGKLAKEDSADFTPFFSRRFDLIFDAIGGEVDAAFDKLSGSLSENELLGSIDKVAAAAFQLAGLSSSIDQSVVTTTIKALEEQGRIQSDALRTYRDTTLYLDDVINAFDSSASSATRLTEALALQQGAAMELIGTYYNLQSTVDSTFGNAISSIAESVMSEEQLYNLRRDQISTLTDQLSNTIDPTKIGNISSEIARLAGSAFNILGPDQQSSAAGEFQSFLSAAQQIAQQQITSGLDLVSDREELNEFRVTAALVEFTDGLNGLPDRIDDAFFDSINGLDGAISRFERAVDEFRNASPSLRLQLDQAGSQRPRSTGGPAPDYEIDLDLLSGDVLGEFR